MCRSICPQSRIVVIEMHEYYYQDMPNGYFRAHGSFMYTFCCDILKAHCHGFEWLDVSMK